MTRRPQDQGTLGSGRNWAAQPLEGGPLTWTVDPAKGSIQGPLDLGFLDGRRISLVLAEGQQALLVQDGQLRAVYLDGAHCLEIGPGRGQVDPGCRLVFLALDSALQASWTRQEPLVGGDAPLVGSCALRIDWPSRFFGTFLRGLDTPEPAFIGRLVAQCVRGLCETLLAGRPSGSPLPTPADLQDGLAACGLVCTHLSLASLEPVQPAAPAPVPAAPRA